MSVPTRHENPALPASQIEALGWAGSFQLDLFPTCHYSLTTRGFVRVWLLPVRPVCHECPPKYLDRPVKCQRREVFTH